MRWKEITSIMLTTLTFRLKKPQTSQIIPLSGSWIWVEPLNWESARLRNLTKNKWLVSSHRLARSVRWNLQCLSLSFPIMRHLSSRNPSMTSPDKILLKFALKNIHFLLMTFLISSIWILCTLWKTWGAYYKVRSMGYSCSSQACMTVPPVFDPDRWACLELDQRLFFPQSSRTKLFIHVCFGPECLLVYPKFALIKWYRDFDFLHLALYLGPERSHSVDKEVTDVNLYSFYRNRWMCQRMKGKESWKQIMTVEQGFFIGCWVTPAPFCSNGDRDGS